MKDNLKRRIRQLLSFGAVESAGRFLNWPIVLLLPMLVPEAEYGIIGLIVALEGLLLEILALGQNRAILRFYRTDDNKKDLLYTVLFIWFFIVILVTALVIVLLLSPVKTFFEIPLFPHLAFFVVAVLLRNGNRMCESLSRAEGLARAFGFFKIGYQLFKIILVFSLAYFLQSAFSYVLGMLLALIVMLFWIVPFLVKRSGNRLQKKRVKQLLLFGWPFAFHVLSGSLLAYVGRFILVGLASKEDVAVYTLASTIGTAVFLSFAALSAYFEPVIYQHSESKVRCEKYLSAYGYLGQTISSLLSIFILFVAPFLIQNYYSTGYHAVIPILPMILASTITRSFYLQGNYRLAVHQKTSYIAFCTIISALLNIILNLYLIPLKGVEGAALALIISNVFFACLTYVISLWRGGIGVGQIRGLLGLIISVLLICSVAVFQNYWWQIGLLGLLFSIGVWHVVKLTFSRSGKAV